MTSDIITPFIEKLGAYGSPVLIIAILWKTGVLEAFASWMKRKAPADPRIDELLAFKELQETNHNTDLAHLLERDRVHDDAHAKLWEAIRKQGEDIAYIRGKIGNGH